MHVIVWQFTARAGLEREFERVYAADGEWARLFARSARFLGTELLRATEGGAYLTIDRWESRDGFAAFQRQWRLDYEALDRRAETLTEEETLIGRFEMT